MKTLVVFYSRTGHTRDVGHRIASALHADMEEIADRVNRRGLVGYIRSGRDGWLQRRSDLMPVLRDPSDYDLVIVGSPVWSASLSSPVLTYLQDYRAKLHDVAFFCTMGGSGDTRLFAQMEDASGRAPVRTLAVRERELGTSEAQAAVRRFTSGLRAFRHAA